MKLFLWLDVYYSKLKYSLYMIIKTCKMSIIGNTIGTQIDSTNYLARIDVNSKKRHRRVKSNHKSDQNNPDGKLKLE